MLNILLIAKDGENYGLASRFKREGHIVKFYSSTSFNHKDKKEVTLLSKWESGIQAADLVLLLSPGFGSVLQHMDDARRIFGCGALDDVLMKNSEVAQNFLSSASSGEVDEGIEITVGGWFANGEFRLVYYTLHTRHFMERNKGLETLGMGCVVVPASKEDPLVVYTLENLKGLLNSMNFYGQIELDVLVDESDVMVMNITSQFRNGVLQALGESWSKSLALTLYKLPELDLELRMPYGVSLGLSRPPWPYSDQCVYEDCNLDMIEPAVKHTWNSLNGNFLGYITSRGITYSEAKRRVFRTVNNIVKDSRIQYRCDVGNYIDACIEQLKSWHYFKKETKDASENNEDRREVSSLNSTRSEGKENHEEEGRSSEETLERS